MLTNDVPGALSQSRDLIKTFCWVSAQHVQAQNWATQHNPHSGGGIGRQHLLDLLSLLMLRNGLEGCELACAFAMLTGLELLKRLQN